MNNISIIIESDYKKFIINYVETLWKIEKKKNILNFIKLDSSYLNNDILKICLKNNIFDAAIYIYIHQEYFTEALNLCKKEITNNIESLFKIQIEQKNLIFKIELFNKHDEIIINAALYVKKKVSNYLKKKGKIYGLIFLNFYIKI